MFTAEQLQVAAAGRSDIHVPYSRLVCIENTTKNHANAMENKRTQRNSMKQK